MQPTLSNQPSNANTSEGLTVIDSGGFRRPAALHLNEAIQVARLHESRGVTVMKIVRGPLVMLEGAELRRILDSSEVGQQSQSGY
jgi:hypothetical protein